MPGLARPSSTPPTADPTLGEYHVLGRHDARLLECRMDAARVHGLDPDVRHPVRLICVMEGQARLTPCDAPAVVLSVGQLALVDLRRIAEAEWSAHRALWFLPPSDLCTDTTLACRVLPEGMTTAAVRTLMHLLAIQGASMRTAAVERLLTGLQELLTHALAAAREDTARGETPDVFRDAQRYLEAHGHRADLRIDDIVRALGCSRTSLYRVFSARSLTVAGYLRELRLLRCRQALAHASPRSNIAQIAYRHGFSDLHAFTRLFKKRFGVTPGQARAHRA